MLPKYETLKSYPVPIELDQDEKEMLSETLARLPKVRKRTSIISVPTLNKKREQADQALLLKRKMNSLKLMLSSHKAKNSKYDTQCDDEIAKLQLIRRIKNNIQEKKQRKEVTIPQLKRELTK